MIGNYLTGLWKQGALMGNTAKESFYVHVGLGETMVETDIWEGRMIVQIGMAVVRPAEFIILQFMQMMQSPS
ncbi:MAG TPA: phage tail protein, partial [Puia sp.]|nr:phage tail protein [Puia sp.]